MSIRGENSNSSIVCWHSTKRSKLSQRNSWISNWQQKKSDSEVFFIEYKFSAAVSELHAIFSELRRDDLWPTNEDAVCPPVVRFAELWKQLCPIRPAVIRLLPQACDRIKLRFVFLLHQYFLNKISRNIPAATNLLLQIYRPIRDSNKFSDQELRARW